MVYWMNDKDNYQIQRWVDNNIVTMVSTLHKADKTALSVQKKPRVTAVNKKHLQSMWGVNYKNAMRTKSD